MELGNQIKALRTQRGVTQEALATALGVSPQAVSKWETQTAAPDIQLLPAISTYFGVTIDQLFALSDEARMERIENMLHCQWDVEPTVIAAYYHLITALLKDDRFNQAMEACDKLGKLDHTPMAPHYRGLITWRSGNREGALKIWEQMVRDFPEDDFAWGPYAEDYTLTGDYAGAVKLLEKAQELEEEPSTTYWEMGGLYRELAGDIPGAIASLEQVLGVMASEGQAEGAGVEAIRQEIQRLKAKG